MNITSFADLLLTARQQPDPQRLLFVFVRAELPDNATPEEVRRFQAGQGGALLPLMFVDKKTDEIGSFAELVEESRHTGQLWDMVFVGCLAGHAGQEPTDQQAQQALEAMVKSVQMGSVGHLLAYRPNAEQIAFA